MTNGEKIIAEITVAQIAEGMHAKYCDGSHCEICPVWGDCDHIFNKLKRKKEDSSCLNIILHWLNELEKQEGDK